MQRKLKLAVEIEEEEGEEGEEQLEIHHQLLHRQAPPAPPAEPAPMELLLKCEVLKHV